MKKKRNILYIEREHQSLDNGQRLFIDVVTYICFRLDKKDQKNFQVLKFLQRLSLHYYYICGEAHIIDKKKIFYGITVQLIAFLHGHFICQAKQKYL